jgi:hypothetical protein
MRAGDSDTAAVLADKIADLFASPSQARSLGLPQGWWPQSLAYGAAGIALLHTERAHAGLAPWQRAHDWLACAAAGGVAAGTVTHLFHGAPALAFALHAAAGQTGAYARALATLDQAITAATRSRLEAAHARMDRGELPALAEFDTIRGLSGIGACLLLSHPDPALLRAVLAYLVRLTEPVTDGGDRLPGWWTSQDPAGKPSADFPGGHANNGVAHGIGGPLSLLSLTARNGVTVDGQAEAIGRICDWLDRWRHDTGAGPWWPYWITRAQVRGEQPNSRQPLRPSWCYGTAGLARAQQLAAIATRDTSRQLMAEHALAAALTDPQQLAATTGTSLCHGHAGLLHIAGRAAADQSSEHLAACLPELLARITPPHATADTLAASLLRADIGLLDGAAGTALALHSASTGTPPLSGWDTCLLIN